MSNSLYIEILAIFEISNANYGKMTIIIANCFFVIFGENDFLYIHGLNLKIFFNSEFRFEIYDKNYPMKENFMFFLSF